MGFEYRCIMYINCDSHSPTKLRKIIFHVELVKLSYSSYILLLHFYLYKKIWSLTIINRHIGEKQIRITNI